jgi:hypothetical protein
MLKDVTKSRLQRRVRDMIFAPIGKAAQAKNITEMIVRLLERSDDSVEKVLDDMPRPEERAVDEQ